MKGAQYSYIGQLTFSFSYSDSSDEYDDIFLEFLTNQVRQKTKEVSKKNI